MSFTKFYKFTFYWKKSQFSVFGSGPKLYSNRCFFATYTYFPYKINYCKCTLILFNLYRIWKKLPAAINRNISISVHNLILLRRIRVCVITVSYECFHFLFTGNANALFRAWLRSSSTGAVLPHANLSDVISQARELRHVCSLPWQSRAGWGCLDFKWGSWLFLSRTWTVEVHDFHSNFSLINSCKG